MIRLFFTIKTAKLKHLYYFFNHQYSIIIYFNVLEQKFADSSQITTFNLKIFLRLMAGTISWYVPKSNDHFRALCTRKSAPKWLFYIFDFDI
jgi:hypothetical protein